ncbi:MAG: CHAP domain-containing protein [Ruminococcus sp.]|nr:CHAP domain-containing protein [Ruminococcus sp.]
MKGGNIIKNIRRKGIYAVFALGVIVSVICACVGVSERNEKVFIPRLSAPEYTNCYYYSDNVFYNSGYGIPNCTAYAWGRVYELTKKKPRLSTANAGDWYEYNKENSIYPYGKEPKLGAVACFNNEYGGHVAVVEDINDGRITFSNSAYNQTEFYLSYADISDENPGQNGWTFQGYIYPEAFKSETKKQSSIRRVSVENGLNFRAGTSVYSDIIDVIPENEELYISSVFNSGGYSWGRTFYNGKVGYCVIDYTVTV